MTEHPEDPRDDAVPYVWRSTADTEQPWAPAAYPRPARVRRPEETPEGLTGRKARKWKRQQVKAARLEQRDQVADAVQGWRLRDEDQIRPLGVAMLVIAVVVAGAVWLWPDPAPAPAAPAAAPSSRAAASTAPRQLPTATQAAPSTSAPAATSGPVPGGDAPAPTTPAELAGAAGEVTSSFLLGYNTYNPAFPDPLAAWLAGWSGFAVPELANGAQATADQLWSFTVADAVAPTADGISDCAQVNADVSSFTYECTVHRVLWPIGAAEGAAYDTDTARWQVTVTGTDTAQPLVIDAQQLSATAPVPSGQ